MITTVTLNPTVDIVVPVQNLARGSVSRSPGIFSYPGGKGTNTARALASLGCETTAAGFCGAADISAMNEFMERFGVSPAFTRISGENRTCILLTETGKPSESVINGESTALIKPAERRILLDNLKRLSALSTHVIMSGSLPLSLPRDFYAQCIRACGAKPAVLLDASSDALKLALKTQPRIVKQNADELGSALGRRLRTRQEIKTAARLLAGKYGIRTVIVTLNEKGAVLFENGRSVHCLPVKVKNPVSPVGSGDAFSAGLVYGLSKGMSPVDSLKWAAAAAAANLENLGACFISASRVKYYLSKTKFTAY